MYLFGFYFPTSTREMGRGGGRTAASAATSEGIVNYYGRRSRQRSSSSSSIWMRVYFKEQAEQEEDKVSLSMITQSQRGRSSGWCRETLAACK